MSFQSLGFALFFPAVSLVYFLIPAGKDNLIRNIWLILAGYFFYMYGNPLYGVFLLYVTLVTYFFGLLFEKKEKSKTLAIISVCVTLLPLLILKYSDFAIRNLNAVLTRAGGSGFNDLNLILPVGISFYSFAALSYVLDVRKKKIAAEHNMVHYALFVGFFPALLSGPIERAGHLIPQLKERHRFDPDRIKRGFLLMLWGYFLKLVLSERIAVYVNKVFGEYESYTGVFGIIAILLYSLQIYFDFLSYTCMALGSGEIMGFDLLKNFERPYFATNIADFWRRWHISLTSFFRDYVYIPLGGNRKGTLRKYFNIMVVFTVSGLWHGASWNFIFWGMINGAFQVAGEILMPVRKKAAEFLRIQTESFGNRMLKTICTFLLASFAWTFFRAESFISAVKMLKNCLVFNPWVMFDGSMLKMGLTDIDMVIIMIALLIVLFVSKLNEKGIVVRDRIDRQDLWFRWTFYITAILIVLILGMYGPMYDPSEFIYFKF
ncbi:MAG: MBOAT family protein [Lachnospiraceae bacterium]|nr:MBOAT family protein [Lachnospiraceae bacterium]